MLIKVRPDLYLNTEQIISVYFREDNKAQIELLGMETVTVSESAARGLLALLEANEDALVLDNTPPPTADLRTRLAVALRDTWKGASIAQLEAVMSTNKKNAGLDATKAALMELEAEQVVLKLDGLYYHASSSEAQTYMRRLRSWHYYDTTITLDGNHATINRAFCKFTGAGLTFTTVPNDVTCAECRQLLGLNATTPSLDPSSEGAALLDAARPAAEHNDSTTALQNTN